MPVSPTYPGVYVEEIPSGVRTIAGVSTSNTAFIGFFRRGPTNEPIQIKSFEDFVRRFGGLDSQSETSYALQQYYLNGGQIAFVVRVASGDPTPAMLALYSSYPAGIALKIHAANPGVWGKKVQVAVGHIDNQTDHFNLVVREVDHAAEPTQVINTEIYLNLSMDADDHRYIRDVINHDSSLIQIIDVDAGPIPDKTGDNVTDSGIVNDVGSAAFKALVDDPDDPLNNAANDGKPPDDSQTLIKGMQTLDKIAPQIFNILCIPGAASLDENSMKSLYSSATKYCEDKRAFLIIDIPEDIDTLDDMMDKWLRPLGNDLRHKNAAVYFPRLQIPDRLNEDRLKNVASSGTLAGIYARTDSARGVWKAPAGTDVRLLGASIVENLTDLENGTLNQLGVNVLRTFPIFGNICWGARTLDGADQNASEWKYIPVRRTALFIEESLFQGLKWVVFEPNDEPLWAQIRLNVGAFMHNLFRQGAFQGTIPRDAYFVKCDKETSTQNDIDRGIVNIIVGFAPLKPAEFVIIKIQQLAGQIET